MTSLVQYSLQDVSNPNSPSIVDVDSFRTAQRAGLCHFSHRFYCQRSHQRSHSCQHVAERTPCDHLQVRSATAQQRVAFARIPTGLAQEGHALQAPTYPCLSSLAFCCPGYYHVVDCRRPGLRPPTEPFPGSVCQCLYRSTRSVRRWSNGCCPHCSSRLTHHRLALDLPTLEQRIRSSDNTARRRPKPAMSHSELFGHNRS